MNPSTSTRRRSALAALPAARAGMTLLEVLVALGILVAGLASVAALLPAAGARLADATAIDRAGTLAANAHADLRNRGLLTPSLFPATTVITASSGRICVFGQAFPDDPFATGTFTKYAIPGSQSTFSMTLQDDVQLSAGTIVANPVSVTYGATVIPTATGTISVGSPVRVGVVVFKRPTVDWMEIPLIKQGAGVFSVSPTITPQDATRKRFLPACSWAFAASGTSPFQACWLRVGSSWTTSGTSYVSFTNADASIISTTAVSGTMRVQAFTNVLRVDERPALLK